MDREQHNKILDQLKRLTAAILTNAEVMAYYGEFSACGLRPEKKEFQEILRFVRSSYESHLEEMFYKE